MNTPRFEIYRASAGSGKTFLLSIHFLSLVLEDPEVFRRILGLTFTNKAAKELKERILYFLGLLAKLPNCNDGKLKVSILENLKNEGWNSSDEQTQQKARKALENILHYYGYFSISTIDAFMYRVVNSFTFDMKIAHDFEVELNEDVLIDEAIQRLLDRVGREKVITELLQNILLEMVDDERGWNIEREIREMAEIIFLEKSNEPLSELGTYTPEQIQEISSNVREYSKCIKKEAQRIAKDVLQKIASTGLSESDFKGGSKGSCLVWVKKFTEEDIKNITTFKSVNEALENDVWFTGKNDTKQSNFRPIKAEIKKNLEELIRLKREYLLASIVYDSLFRLPLYSNLYRTLEEIKLDNNVLHISDFNRLISKVIRSEPVPYIYVRLGMRFKHFLLDEFQDTSVQQWHNLVPLLHNALSGGEDGYARIVIVGDGKQSIYRWRNGELEIFEKLPQIFRKPEQQNFDEAEHLFASFSSQKPKVLKENFRSLKSIVDFNHKFFSHIKESLGEEARRIYRDTKQETDKSRQGGLVQWEWVTKNDAKDDSDNHLKRISQIINELLNHSDKKYSLNEMAILVRKNDEAQRIADFLIQKNIPVVSPDSLMLNQSESVRRVISWLKLIAQPDDRLALATAIELNQGMKDVPEEKELLHLTQNNREKNLLQKSGEEILKNVFGSYSFTLFSNDLYTLTQKIMKDCQLNNPPDIFCQAFLEKIKGQNRYTPFSLEEFLDEWDQNQDTWAVSFPEDMDAIRIMTIHKAKGLEFPVVIRPYLFSRPNYNSTEWVATSEILDGIDRDFWSNFNIPWLLLDSSSKFKDSGIQGLEKFYNDLIEKQLIEDLNLMYVAFTRAKERLYIFAYPPSSSDSDSNLLPKESKKVLEEHFCFKDGQIFIYSEDATKKQQDEVTGKLGEEETKRLENFKTIETHCEGHEEKDKTMDEDIERLGDKEIEENVISTRMHIRPLAPQKWEASSPDTERELGKMIHLLLDHSQESEVLKNIPEFHQMTKKMGETFGSALIENLRILKNDPLYSAVFERQGEKLTEREILLPDGKWLRPDLIILGDGFTVVADYKTGQPHPQYEKQMHKYIETLLAAGYPSVEGYLVYLGNPPHIERAGI
ncbi:MAG: UvrD-helicase domain-containing protein [Bacteroidales bacterium]|nr:UvrD-helicase domain-containing protein [Bacteroidales bacterium]